MQTNPSQKDLVHSPVVTTPTVVTTGDLSVKSIPNGVRTYINDEYVGNTPLNNHVLEEGSYNLKLTKTGYEDLSVNLRLRAGQNLEREFALTTITVSSPVTSSRQTVTPVASGSLTPPTTVIPQTTNVRQNNNNLSTGKVTTAQELVQRAKQGGRVEIAAGRYVLHKPLILSNDVELIGAGRDKTFIVSTAEHFGIGFESNGNFKAQSIAFEHTGELTANVVWVHNGTVNIDDCIFEGGVTGKEPIEVRLITATHTTIRGSGLLLTGKATGVIRGSIFEKNNSHGVTIDNEAQPRLEQNILRNNEGNGILYADNAGGTAVANTIKRNYVGIFVLGEAQPRLEQNTLGNNKETGIAYRENAGGTAIDNIIEDNAYCGINVQGEAQPRLEQNIVRNNGYGIFYDGNAEGIAIGNISEGNSYNGISLGGKAQPRLEQNTSKNNKQAGIAYFGNAGGTAIGNISEGNGKNGISVQGEAQPRLESNHLHNNQGYGIAILDQADPSIDKNIFSGNEEGDKSECGCGV